MSGTTIKLPNSNAVPLVGSIPDDAAVGAIVTYADGRQIKKNNYGAWDNYVPRNERPSKQNYLLLADIQPDVTPDAGNTDQVAFWRNTIIPEINSIAYDSDIAILAGDLLDRGYAKGGHDSDQAPGQPYLFDDLIEDLRNLPVPFDEIYVIPGNHDTNYAANDADPDAKGLVPYLKAFPRVNYYTLRGNVLTIYMGDQRGSTAQEIAQHTFEWWKDIVETNQDKFIVTVTHAPLKDTVLISEDVDWSIKGSSRFTSVLESESGKVDLWISAHITPDHQQTTKHGTLHVSTGMHIPGFTEGANPTLSWCTMELSDGSRDVRLRRYEHTTQSYSADFTFQARHPIALAAKCQFDGRHQTNDRYSIKTTPGTVLGAVQWDVANPGYSLVKDYWLNHFILEDNYNTNLLLGISVGELFHIPGGTPATVHEGVTNIRNYGVGGSLKFRKISHTDSDYSCAAVLQASTAGDGEDSLVDAVVGDPVVGVRSPLRPNSQGYMSTDLTLTAGQENYISSYNTKPIDRANSLDKDTGKFLAAADAIYDSRLRTNFKTFDTVTHDDLITIDIVIEGVDGVIRSVRLGTMNPSSVATTSIEYEDQRSRKIEMFAGEKAQVLISNLSYNLNLTTALWEMEMCI